MKYFLRIVILYISCNIVHNSEDCVLNFQNCVKKNENLIKMSEIPSFCCNKSISSNIDTFHQEFLNCTVFSWAPHKSCVPQESDTCYETICKYTSELSANLTNFQEMIESDIMHPKDSKECMKYVGTLFERNLEVCENVKNMAFICDIFKLLFPHVIPRGQK
ncbi:uncharacterized protein [Centruroides vittatus]|uniref:uncharacterized protein n=1 Tax=Centruroides vittatus TaxID=120091 RepID=UPI00350F622D